MGTSPRGPPCIESHFGHVKGEHPHLDKIADPGELEAELERARVFYNEVRLHQGLGYVTPDDEHHGRGDARRAKRRSRLQAAQNARIAFRRQLRQDQS